MSKLTPVRATTKLTRVRERTYLDGSAFKAVCDEVYAFAKKHGVSPNDVFFDFDYYSDDSSNTFLMCDRPETPPEREKRLALEEEQRIRQDAWDKKQLEELKKKYPEKFK